jgi:hypothetical protein
MSIITELLSLADYDERSGVMKRAAFIIDEMRDALAECREYFDSRADADHNGSTFVANDAMVLVQTIDAALRKTAE